MNKPEFFKLKEKLPPGIEIVDAFNRSLSELFFIRNPKFKKGAPGANEALAKFMNNGVKTIQSIYVYYSWAGKAVSIPEEKVYFELRTARNKNIINKKEQEKYRNIKIGIAGMSVGSNIATTLALTGGPKNMKLADFDEIEATNLNRIRAGLGSIGQNKAMFFARQIWEFDPWAELEIYDKGLNKDNIEDFIKGLDIFIDEMDSIELKVHSRFICKKLKIPVLMATDNGDNVIFDVERYDQNPDLAIFNGRVKIAEEELANMKTFQDWIKIAAKIVGAEIQTPRLLQSILELGKTVAGVPQLGSSAAMAGAAASYAVRKIASGDKLPSGRYDINLDEKMTFGYGDPENVAERKKTLKNFLSKFGK
jgi:tRNA threonylcarbamoyladenosine dehydratase